MDRAGVINRMARLGLRPAADALREEIRARHKAAGMTRDKASEAAWIEMAAVFEPIAEKLEQEQASGDDAPLQGCTDDLAPLLDPAYSEADPGKRLRDGLLWTAEEIRRVVRDTNEGTTIDLARASTPPPSAWAVFCLESYARKPVAARAELIARVIPFATKGHDPNSKGQQGETDEGGFLDKVGDTSPP